MDNGQCNECHACENINNGKEAINSVFTLYSASAKIHIVPSLSVMGVHI